MSLTLSWALILVLLFSISEESLTLLLKISQIKKILISQLPFRIVLVVGSLLT